MCVNFTEMRSDQSKSRKCNRNDRRTKGETTVMHEIWHNKENERGALIEHSNLNERPLSVTESKDFLQKRVDQNENIAFFLFLSIKMFKKKQ